MHGLHRIKVLVYYGFDASAAFVNIPLKPAQNAHIRIGIDKQLDIK